MAGRRNVKEVDGLGREVRAYEGFRGATPSEAITTHLPDQTVKAWHMGDVEAIAYRTERDGKREHYLHEFKQSAGPSLVVADDGRQLYLTGGNYRVTNRGIEDGKNMPPMLIVNPRKRGTKAKRKALPMAKTKKRSGVKTIVVKANPVRRRRKHYSAGAVKTSHRYKRRRNPIGGKGHLNIMDLAKAALMQGGGAVVTSIATGFLPANMRAGSMAGVANAGVGLVLGWGISKMVNKKLGQAFAEGALTIAVYNVMKGMVPTNVNMGEFVPMENLGEFVSQDNLGYVSASALAPGMDYATLYGSLPQGTWA